MQKGDWLGIGKTPIEVGGEQERTMKGENNKNTSRTCVKMF